MSKWTYTLKGGSAGTIQHTSDDDEPGHIVIAEREAEHGVCDLYILTSRSTSLRVGTYEWLAAGTPDEVMAKFARVVGLPGGGQVLMGWESQEIRVWVSLRLDAHGGEHEREDDALAAEMFRRIHEAVRPIIKDPKFARIIVLADGPAGSI